MDIRLLYHKAYALMHLNRTQEGEAHFKRCLMFSYALGESAPSDMKVKHHKDCFKATFGYELDLTIKI